MSCGIKVKIVELIFCIPKQGIVIKYERLLDKQSMVSVMNALSFKVQ